MEENKKGKKKLLLVIAIFAVIFVIVVGGTYSYFAARATNTGAEITGRTLDIDGTKLTIAASRVNLNPTPVPVSDNLVPARFGVEPTEITTTEVNRALDKKCSVGGYTGCHVWKVTATSSMDIPSANIKLNLSLSNVQNKDQWSYAVYRGGDTNSETILSKGYINTTFPNSAKTLDIHNGASLTKNTPAIYYVMIYLNNTNSVQNDGVVTGTTNETGTYNGTVILEAMGGEVYVNFYEKPTDLSFFTYSREVLETTYTVTDQSACQSSLVTLYNGAINSEQATTLCTGGNVYGATLNDIVSQGVTLNGVEVNILYGNVMITGYHNVATYTVSNQSACESYLANMGATSEQATTLCSGGSINGESLGGAIAGGTIPSSDYEAAGLSNVAIIPAPTDVVIPSTIEGYPVTSIDTNAFYNKGLTSVVIPNSVTSIGDQAFQNNSLTSVEIPSSVTSIGMGSFRNNSLTSVVIPNSVTSIGDSAFSNNSLTSVVIPNSVTTIGDSVFKNNSLTSVEIPSSVTSISFNAFENNSLTSLVIPNSVTSIGQEAFRNNKLTSVVIPNSVTSIGSNVFNNGFDTTTNTTLNIDMVTIRSSAFYNAGIKNLILGQHVETIEGRAFRSNSLTSVVIPSNVTSIGIFAFDNNPFTSIAIGNQNATIGNCAFGSNPPLGEPFLSSYECIPESMN